MLEGVAVHAEADVRLVGRLLVHLDSRVAVETEANGLRLARLSLGHVTEELLNSLVQAVADLAPDAEDHPRGLIPVADVGRERVARRSAHGLLAADDVPAQRLVVVEKLLVHPADEVPRRVE